MDTADSLKEQARTLESQGQDQAALELYERIAREEGDPDPGVLVRLGNLQLRLGIPDQAVSSFERCAERLAGEGFANGALALLQRVLRIRPGHAPAMLRLGQLSAGQGYAGEARDWYLRFAERAREQGEPDAAQEALRDYLRVFPRDPEVRRLLGEEPEEALQPDEALEPELPSEPVDEVDEGDGAELPVLAPPDEPLEGLQVTGSAWEGADLPEPPAGADPDLGLLPTRVEEADLAGEEVDAVAGLEPTLLEGLEPTTLDPDPTDWGAGDADVVDDADDADWDGSDAGGLPLLGAEPDAEPESEVADPLQRIRARVVRDPLDLDARHELVALLQERGEAEELVAALEEAHPRFAAEGRYAEATDLLSGLIDLRPADLETLELRVEYAESAGDVPRAVAALLALGRRLDPSATPDRAREVFGRVLELDAGNEEARGALDWLAPPEQAAEEPFDFESLLLDDEPAGTRAQVAVDHPSGDDQRDFEEILSLFRQEVSEKIDPADAASHYDLGLAFREMGLLDDAIQQLQVALRGGANPVATLEVLGECFVQKGEHSLAARVFRRATELPTAEEDSLVGVRYWLGRCEEELGDAAAARAEYERVVAVDMGFRDVASRLKALRS